jgi:chlorite dismutase
LFASFFCRSAKVLPTTSLAQLPRFNMNNRFSFIGGKQGAWRVQSMKSISGVLGLESVERLEIVNEAVVSQLSPDSAWVLQGFTSNVRYANRKEINALKAIQPDLGRPEAVCAVLIPIKKSGEWWNMSQDERRSIFEEDSHHTAIGLEYLPSIARRLHHCRDLGEEFDFLTWFEFAPEHSAAFDELLVRLRASKEWTFVEREAEIRLTRD